MIYIHIPFCKSRCVYCDFFSSTQDALKQDFVEALCGEMSGRREEMLRAGAQTVYLGGGTPSYLGGALLQKLFLALEDIVKIAPEAEVTLECNPDDITEELLASLRSTPVNRVSMGIQTLHDDLLTFLHRRHNAEQARKAVKMLKDAGYRNLSVDLMFGLPGQTMEMWRHDVDEVLGFGVTHLSAYSLQWEEGTPLFRMLEHGEAEEAPEELSLEMYEYVVDATRKCGMEHYEISNFALPGKRSRHNSGYWKDEPYVGLGPGAHSYDGSRVRSSNPADLIKYIRCGGKVERDEEILTPDQLYEEKVLKGLRTKEGLDLSTLDQEYRDYALKMAAKHLQSAKLLLQGDRLRLSEQGVFVSNDIMSDMML